jgi:hypothetical protein
MALGLKAVAQHRALVRDTMQYSSMGTLESDDLG